MRIYVCTVCGYDYDEKAGDPGNGVAPGTKWEDLPEDWVCPICGADKSMFELQGGGGGAAPGVSEPLDQPAPVAGQSMKKLAIMASNLARGASKQYREEAVQALTRLAGYYEARALPEGDLGVMAALLNQDIQADYAAAFEAARGAKDRGALRALTWGEKVSKIQSGLLARFQKEGAQAFEQGSFFVCDACGFIFYGDEAPEICPVCKVPRFKFDRVPKGVIA